MNPNTTIKKWLLACGKQYGIRQAHDYRWPDADTRQHEMYFTYRLMSSEPEHIGTLDMSTKSANVALRKAAQKWITTVRVDLHHSQDGLFELASCIVALRSDPVIRAIFNDQCSLSSVTSLTNESRDDFEEIIYHHRLVCTFEEDITFELSDANAVFDDIELTVTAGDYTHTITNP